MPSREIALKRAESWILERLGFSDGLGAIFPPIVNTIFALHALGYSFEHPTIKQQIRELEKLEIEEDETLRVQPCFSPVWDTAYAINALVDSGLEPDHEALMRAADWMLDKRGHGCGDWRVKNKQVSLPGWFFEYANPFYPTATPRRRASSPCTSCATRGMTRNDSTGRFTRRITGTQPCTSYSMSYQYWGFDPWISRIRVHGLIHSVMHLL